MSTLSSDQKALTFRHLIAGSNFIMPAGKILTFAGPRGGTGDYTTSDAGEIKELMFLVKTPNCPVECVIDETGPEARPTPVSLKKAVDPAIEKSVEDAASSAIAEATPAVATARDTLSKIIAVSKQS